MARPFHSRWRPQRLGLGKQVATGQGGLPVGSSDHTARRSGVFTQTASWDARIWSRGGVPLSAGSGQAQNAPEEGRASRQVLRDPRACLGAECLVSVPGSLRACTSGRPASPCCREAASAAAASSWTLRGQVCSEE